MIRKILFCCFICMCWAVKAQQNPPVHQIKTVKMVGDTLELLNKKINPLSIQLLDFEDKAIDTSWYKIDQKNNRIIFHQKIGDSIQLKFKNLPDFLTKTYSLYDPKLILENIPVASFQNENRTSKPFVPFDGLQTSGSISRGITVGNNQNSVLNSNLDLQITGKLSDKVNIRASIQDNNIPVQNGGYSQKLDEFDQLFVELFSTNWSLRAGDLFLENRQTSYLNFNKKVQGLSSHFNWDKNGNKTDIYATAALVRGQYAKSTFTGQEGNQGPYKLKGPNGELYVLVISGSERVYVNGRLLQRGETNDYVIDYNAGEITFTSLFPITSEMRINIEYQYSDRNFTRFVTYAGATHTRKNWSIGGFLYSENDMKNQPLQQSLSPDQVEILKQAGNDKDKMYAPSAYQDVYSENKILYKKVLANGIEFFEFSNNQDDTLYNVKFSLVGNNQGNYILANNAAVGKIYEYIPPIQGIPQGNYEPITRLIAPTKIQIATVIGSYKNDDKTKIDFEIATSNNDQNLYSSIDDNQNTGMAGHINAVQRIVSGKIQIDAFSKWQFIQQNFATIERLFSIEFNRDWNIQIINGNQSILTAGVSVALPQKGSWTYQWENLTIGESFSGNKHSIFGSWNTQNWTIRNHNSILQSEATTTKTQFIRTFNQAKYHWKKNWIGIQQRAEDNQQKEQPNQQLTPLSQRFSEYGAMIGRGDSTKVFVELGFLHRLNDSTNNGLLTRVNQSTSYYIKSKLIDTAKRNLSVFFNYRNVIYSQADRKNQPSINSRLQYSDRFWDQLLQLSTTYENTSGSIAQQEFTYLEVEPGLGTYTWIDYNNNGIQELEEFEIAVFQDQARYVRIFLPNQVYLKTHQNRLAQSVVLNFLQFQNKTNALKILSKFYNQTSWIVERKIARNGNNFDFNPLATNGDDVVGLSNNFSNTLFFNRGKQHHSVSYTFNTSEIKNLLSIGSQFNSNRYNQLQYIHLLKKSWLITVQSKTGVTSVESENYSSKNYKVESIQWQPKIAYLFSKNTSWEATFEWQKKENTIGNLEQLIQSRWGTTLIHNSTKNTTINAEISLYNNQFTGDQMAPVAYQMMEGLQPGKNYTWRLLLQKNLTKYLDLNISYQGRKTENSSSIHTGSVQLRAFF